MENFQKLWLLLDVVHKAAAAGPQYQWIIAMADSALIELKADMVKGTTASARDMAMEHPELKDFAPAGVVHG